MLLFAYSSIQNFNPRPRVGGDSIHRRSRPLAGISIHAPAWGATEWEDTMVLAAIFQSTPPRGGRRFGGCSARRPPNFNPRPRVGGDLTRWFQRDSTKAFQSTPPRGGRLAASVVIVYIVLFQSTPPRGGRQPKHREISASGNPDISYDTSDSPRFTMISSCFSREPPRNF